MSDNSQLLTISKVAKQTGITKTAIRFYERNALISKPKRASNGYRLYSVETVNQLKFIIQIKELGFTLYEISEFIKLQQMSQTSCKHSKPFFLKKINQVNKKIDELSKLNQSLNSLIKTCKWQNTNKCPFFNDLSC